MENKVCTRCVMDTSDPDIYFDDKGVCNHCKHAEKVLSEIKINKGNFDIYEWAEKIKKSEKDKEYDVVTGISGGVDSSYVLYLLKKLGLRVLAVHIDNGWNTELSVQNIRVVLEKLDIDLYTYVLNWQEFRDIQLSFLKASVPDCEIPTDHLIFPVLSLVAHSYGLKYIVTGSNEATESILPQRWSHGHRDWKYIRSIHNMYGTIPIKTFVYLKPLSLYYFQQKMDWINILDYVDYNKAEAKDLLIKNFGWRDYGGKHYESFYTKFYQAYILPTKFGFDKRKAHLSNLIMNGEITRDEALKQLQEPLYDPDELIRDKEYFCEKMSISIEEFEQIMEKPAKSFWDYPSYENGFINQTMLKILDIVKGKNEE